MLRIEFKQFVMRGWRRSAGEVMMDYGEVVMRKFFPAEFPISVIPVKTGIHLARQSQHGFPPSRE